MKKTILFLTMLFASATFLFSQTATVSYPDLNEAGGPVFVNLTVDAISSDLLIGQWYLAYDPAHLTYVGTSYPNAQFPGSEWVAGTNGTEWGANWVPGDFVPEVVSPGDILCTIQFTYSGTDCTDLSWTTGGITIMWDNTFTEYILTLIDGSVCPAVTDWIWEGDVSEDWFADGNWNQAGFPGAADDVIIPAGTPWECHVVGDAFCNDMTIDVDAWFWLGYGDFWIANTASGTLDADGVVTCNGVFAMMGDLNNGASSFLHDGIAGGGFFVYSRDVVSSGADPDGWHLIASPVPGQTTDQMYDYFFNYWNEPTAMWMHHEGMTNCVAAPAMGLNVGYGYAVKYDLGYECDGVNPGTGWPIEFANFFTTLETGVITVNGTYSNVGIPGETMNFNLFGNPFPAYWYYEDMFPGGLNNLADAMYLYDDVIGDYRTWVGGAGDANDGYVAPCQGMFFLANGPDPSLTMNYDECSNETWPWFKSERPGDVLALKASGNNIENNTFIKFVDEATDEFDVHYDAYNIPAQTITHKLYTTINGVAYDQNAVASADMMTLNFTSGTNGIYTIEAYESDMDYVVLEDLYTGETTDLLSESYEFAYNTQEPSDRFVIHFTPGTVGNDVVNIWSNANSIYVTIPSDINGDIVVYNVTGQEVVRQNAERGMNIIEMAQNDSYFVVKVIAEEMTETGKVFIK
jgi:hypothetical protein